MMAVYVDALRTGAGLKRRQRLMADSVEELHSFAERFRIPRHLFRKAVVPYYEISQEVGDKSVQRGARRIGKGEVEGLVKVYQDARMTRRIERGVGCPFCGSVYSKVVKTERKRGYITRYRVCLSAKCGRRYSTVEK